METGRNRTGVASPQLVLPAKKYVRLTLIMGVYSLCFVGIKLGLPFAPPLLFGGIRMALGGLFLISVSLALRSPLWPRRTPVTWILILAFVLTPVSTATMFLAGAHASAGLASVLGNVQPIVTLVLALTILHEAVTPRKVACAIVGLVGIVAITLPTARESGMGMAGGAVLALASSVVVAASNILVKRFVPSDEVLQATAWQIVLSCLPILAVSWVYEDWSSFTLSPVFAAVVLFLGVVGTGVNSYAWYRVLKEEDAGLVSMFYFTVPVLGLFASWVVFAERPLPAQWLGIGLITLSLLIVGSKVRNNSQS